MWSKAVSNGCMSSTTRAGSCQLHRCMVYYTVLLTAEADEVMRVPATIVSLGFFKRIFPVRAQVSIDR